MRKIIFLIAIMALVPSAPTATLANERAENSQGLNETDTQNWSRNWATNWHENIKKRSSKFQELMRWEISERTLISLYGQLNVGQLQFDDGFTTDVTVRDNANSPSRIGFRIDTDVESGGNFLFNFEAALPRSNYESFFSGGLGDDWDKKLIRKAEGRWNSPKFGYFSFGQGSMAADGITGFDFSGTNVVASNAVGDTVSDIPATLSDGTKSSINLAAFFPTYDASRRFRLRYDSLPWNNVSVAVSAGRDVLSENNDNTYADVALRYETSWHGYGIKGGFAYSYNGDNPGFISGSVAGLDEETGLNFALAAGANTASGQYAYGKLGWKHRFVDWGTTALSIDYYTSSDIHIAAYGSQSWGVSVVQKGDLRGWELYATYREYSVDGTTTDYADSKAILLGTRILW